MEEKLELLKILADKTRLAILNILLREDSYVEKIACELSLTPATICYHLKKMEAAGVVHCSRTQYYIIYSLNREIFDKPLYEIIQKEEESVDREEKYTKEVLSHFFKNGRLTQLPTQRKKREIVLREIAKQFENGKMYEEKEVNAILHILLHMVTLESLCDTNTSVLSFHSFFTFVNISNSVSGSIEATGSSSIIILPPR